MPNYEFFEQFLSSISYEFRSILLCNIYAILLRCKILHENFNAKEVITQIC